MKLQSWIKSLSQKYDPYLTWVLLILMLSSLVWNIYSIHKDIALSKQREQAQERLANLFQQGDKLKEKSQITKAEIDKINQEVQQCLQQNKPKLNKCQNILNKSIAMNEELKKITKEYEQLMINIDKDYCFLYPDPTDRKCQQIKKN